jgi:hypothetical protein
MNAKKGSGITQQLREVPSDNVGLPFQQTVRRQEVKSTVFILYLPINAHEIHPTHPYPHPHTHTHTYTHTHQPRQTDRQT